jgi:membrane protein implicated in regulation of membrane protease activity
VVIHKGVSTGAAAGIGVGVVIAVLIIPLIGIFWFVRKRKAEKGGMPRKPELHGESRVVSELDSDEKQRAEIGGIPWRVSSPISEEVGEVHELGGRGV